MSDTLPPLRRVVTGHDAAGLGTISIEDAGQSLLFAGGQATFTLMWSTASSPADNNDARDGAQRRIGLTSPGGTALRIVDFAPGSRSPMHRTHSLDYGIVLEGEIDLELEGGETRRLRPGDIVVQRGTNHAWICGSRAARMAFVLIEASPVRVGLEMLPEIHP